MSSGSSLSEAQPQTADRLPELSGTGKGVLELASLVLQYNGDQSACRLLGDVLKACCEAQPASEAAHNAVTTSSMPSSSSSSHGAGDGTRLARQLAALRRGAGALLSARPAGRCERSSSSAAS
jgi:hypothetical protein